MKPKVILNNDERRLITALAKGVHYLYLKHSKKIEEHPEGYLWDFLQRHLYNGLNFLWLTQLAFLEEGERFCDLSNPEDYAEDEPLFAVPFNEIEDRIRFEGLEAQTPFTPNPVVCFLGISEHVGLCKLNKVDAFSIDPILQTTMSALLKSGHAKRIGEKYFWTYKALLEENRWV